MRQRRSRVFNCVLEGVVHLIPKSRFLRCGSFINIYPFLDQCVTGPPLPNQFHFCTTILSRRYESTEINNIGHRHGSKQHWTMVSGVGRAQFTRSIFISFPVPGFVLYLPVSENQEIIKTKCLHYPTPLDVPYLSQLPKDPSSDRTEQAGLSPNNHISKVIS